MQSFIWRVRLIHVVLIASIFFQALPFSKSLAADEAQLQNVRFEVSGVHIFIYYDLIGPQDEEYEVTLSLRLKSDQSFVYTPKMLSGDVGRGTFAGQNRKIAWDTSKEFPQGLAWNDYYFVVGARIVSRGIPALLWMGTVAIAGGALVYLLLSRNTETSPSTVGFPNPPARPR
jgi:hypothetical protein